MTESRYAFLEPGKYARGWHVVLFSQELDVGEVRQLHYFDRDLVIYRGASGQVAMLDAHCPHLGANLGSGGGRLIGDNIACPFHGWTFDPAGHCVDIPYASKIPERAVNALRGYPVLEKNGFIAIWYDPESGEAEDYLPDIPQWGEGADGWGDWKFFRSRIRARACDVIENIVDIAHFPHVHGGSVVSFENSFAERSVTQRSRVKQSLDAKMMVPPGLPFDFAALREQGAQSDADAWGDATYHGPTTMYYYTESRGSELSYQSWWLNCHIPVNDEELDLCSGVIFNSLTDEPLPEEFIALYPQTAHAAFGQDVEIWKDKIYQEDPILCDGDGPIAKLRRWYEQFYLPR
jgi:3-ketosteroid 9alpha-monooxygenase subunit A